MKNSKMVSSKGGMPFKTPAKPGKISGGGKKSKGGKKC